MNLIQYSDCATISGGQNNSVCGDFGMIPGGQNNVATNYCFAAGRNANASNSGAFVWADSRDFGFYSTNSNEFAARCTGSVRFVSAITMNGTPIAGVALLEISCSSLSLHRLARVFTVCVHLNGCTGDCRF